MKTVLCAPIIEDMTWSYSRIKAFYDCKYRWLLKYLQPRILIRDIFDENRPSKMEIDKAYEEEKIDKTDVGILYDYLGIKKANMFFSDYGSFVHKLIELYYRGEKTQSQLCDMYLQEFKSRVRGRAPSPKVFGNYFKSGLNYIRNIAPFPYNMIAVEKRVDFSMDGIPFIGYIDFLGEKDGELYVVDNKSKTLKPRSTRPKPAKTDEELDDYLRQLYIYSAAVEQEYGKRPKSLCFNCFREQLFIEEPFQEKAYAEAKRWLSESVAEITKETDFRPDIEYFRCTYLCEMNGHCEYYKLSQKKR